jgi:hypothetical protein
MGNDTVLNFTSPNTEAATLLIEHLQHTTLVPTVLQHSLAHTLPTDHPLHLKPLTPHGHHEPRIPRSQCTTAASARHAEAIRASVANEPYTNPADIPQAPRHNKPKEGRLSYAAIAAHQPNNRRSTTTPSKKTQRDPNPTPTLPPPTQAQQPPTFNEEAFALRINNQVDLQISKLQNTLAAQFEGPFVDTIKHVFNDELLINNAFTIALKAHFATFDHAKFALIPAT